MKKIVAATAAAMIMATSAGAESIRETFLVADAIKIGENQVTADGVDVSGISTIETGIDGMTLSVGADKWKYKAGSTTYNDITYNGYISGGSNPKPAEGTGTYYEFAFDSTVAPGTLEVMYQLGAGKAFYITDNGEALDGFNGVKYEQKVYQSSTFNVEPNHKYCVYASGSKLAFYGCTYTVVDREADFAAEIEAFSFDTIKGENTDENTIDSDLELIDNYESKFGACDVRWTSSNEDVINNAGEVNARKEDTTVELTGIFTVQEDDTLSASKTFTVTVPADSDDLTAVTAAAEALTIGDTSALKKDLVLPVSGKKGTDIVWSTSDSSVITAEGVITRYPGQDKSVTLTATVSRGEASTTKDFSITVLGYVPVTIDTYVYGNTDGSDCFGAVDGGSLKRISFTSSIKDPKNGDMVIAVVYDKEGRMKSCKGLAVTAEMYDKSTTFEIGLAMDSTDTFKITAINAVTLIPYIESKSAEDTVADGAVIYVVGDSTAAVYGDKNYPRKGWAQLLQNYFDDVTVVDYALSGRSSLNFKSETNYAKLKNEIKAGDYLIVQFGHNDSKADDATRYTSASGDRFTEGTFKNSMLEYIELARDKGANPIIATSISRCKLSDSSLESYVKAAKELGEETDTPVIDLYARTNGWINEVGVDEAKSMFNFVKINDSRFINDSAFASSSYKNEGSSDSTHLNVYGADLISQWACEELLKIAHPLSGKVNEYRATYPLPSYGAAYSAE